MSAKIYKSYDKDSPNPNDLSLIPTLALIREIILRKELAFVTLLEDGERCLYFSKTDRRGLMVLSHLASFAQNQIEAYIPKAPYKES